MRAINHDALDGEDLSILASGHTVFDLSIGRRPRRNVDLTSRSTTSPGRFY
jgi:hypothetical protein